MSTKSDYTEQEWEGLLQAPVMAGMYIMVADVSVTAMGKEMAGMLKAIQAQNAPDAAKELVSAVVADIVAKSSNKEKLEQPELDKQQDPKVQIMKILKDDLAVLDEKATPEEKSGFGAWLMTVAQATAEAGREGGFLTIGSVHVSDKEKTALAELKAELG
ncbi:MAG: hypothetical protein IAF02_04805 [Anaerolineae bacterium]|nr:hypothetical protein [Anaerolineae bacterium]